MATECYPKLVGASTAARRDVNHRPRLAFICAPEHIEAGFAAPTARLSDRALYLLERVRR